MSTLTSLVGNPESFPILQRWHFFNHAGVAPLPAVAGSALRKFASQAEDNGYLASGWYDDIESLRQESAALLNCHRDEIAFIKNTSEGISIVANGIQWQFGDRIVTTKVEYPANIYPWMEAVRRSGAKLVTVEEEDGPDGCRHVPVDKIIQAAADPRTKLITLSSVEFASGQRHELARIGQFCAERKIRFCVDAIQSLGVIPLDVKEMNIDYLAADGHKWLLGPEGAGIFYCRRELLEFTRPLVIGWMNVVDAKNFGNYDYTLRTDAGRFESGSFNVPGLLALRASLKLLQSAGIEQIGQRIKALTDMVIEGVRARGYRVVSPRNEQQWSGIVAFTSAKFAHDKVFQELRREHRIELAVRERRLRCSPHFYNTETQIEKLLAKLPKH